MNDTAVASLREDASALIDSKNELLRTMESFHSMADAYIEALDSRR